MDELSYKITAKAEDVLHAAIGEIHQFENVSSNSVYKITAGQRPYIFKIYKQRDWPEDGKLAFIQRKLIEHEIACAKLIAFDRDDAAFPAGCLIEECLPGQTADRMAFDRTTGVSFYKKLAELVSKVHRIRLVNYGYIGYGTASHASFLDYMNEIFEMNTDALIRKRRFERNALDALRTPLMERLRGCEDLPSVLNHGDLSTKNVVVNEWDELTLIDWDDAVATTGLRNCLV